MHRGGLDTPLFQCILVDARAIKDSRQRRHAPRIVVISELPPLGSMASRFGQCTTRHATQILFARACSLVVCPLHHMLLDFAAFYAAWRLFFCMIDFTAGVRLGAVAIEAGTTGLGQRLCRGWDNQDSPSSSRDSRVIAAGCPLTNVVHKVAQRLLITSSRSTRISKPVY